MASMHPRTALLTAVLALTALPGASVADTDWSTTSAALRAQATDTPTILSAFQTWKMLSTNDRLPFDSYATFLMRYPDWPEAERMRRVAEGAVNPDSEAPSAIVAFFDRLPPLTPTGWARYAAALHATGDAARGLAAARNAWHNGPLSADDEARLINLYGPQFTLDDHDAREDALLWAHARDAAMRQITLTSTARRPVFAARLAMQGDAPDAAALVAASGTGAMGDAGFVADRAHWMAANGHDVDARLMLAARPALTTPASDPALWYETLYHFAHEAANDHQWSTAYAIASHVDDGVPTGAQVSALDLKVRDPYTSLTWLAGQTALDELGRPADAIPMFTRYATGGRSPQTIAKGYYWAARAARAAGQTDLARQDYTAAGAYYDQFYGQLALEALNQPLPTVTRANLSGLGNPASNPLFMAASVAGRYGSWQEQSLFLRAIARNATSEEDHRAAIALSSYLGRPDLAVMAGRDARVEGIGSLVSLSYPTVAVPGDLAGDWTMIHAISRQESQFDRNIISHAGARGLMQLMPGTARQTAGKLNLSYDGAALTGDTTYNIRLGAAVWDRLFAYYGSYPLAVAAYNAGPGNVNRWLDTYGDPRTGHPDMVRWIEQIPIYETKNYVERVLENAVMYDHLNPDRAKMHGDHILSAYLGQRED